jgi:hypothetical protein
MSVDRMLCFSVDNNILHVFTVDQNLCFRVDQNLRLSVDRNLRFSVDQKYFKLKMTFDHLSHEF